MYVIVPHTAVEGSGVAKKVDLEAVPVVNGVPLNELDLESMADKPWRLPGEEGGRNGGRNEWR